MHVLVIGSALREICGDQAALGLTFLEEVSTAPKYRLYVVEDRYAALVGDEDRGIAVPGELVEVDDNQWAEIVADEPHGITFGPVELADGRHAIAALGDREHLSRHGQDITPYGGFAAFAKERERPPAA